MKWDFSLDRADTIASSVREGVLNPAELVLSTLNKIEKANGDLNAFLVVDREGAMASAVRISAQVSAGEHPGRLAGVPFAIKANFCKQGLPASCGSLMLENYLPPYTATSVQALEDEGAILVGICNMDEFAMGSSTEFSAFGPTKNPHDLSLTPGGSSGGCAAAVAAGIVPFALGSDTGGSVRQPASLCGVFGLQPTYGRISRHGLISFSSSLDTVGIFARNSRDLAIVYSIISGPDNLDSTCMHNAPEIRGLPMEISKWRIGLPSEFFKVKGLEPAVRDCVMQAINSFSSRGATIIDVSLPSAHHSVAVYHLIAQSEASSNLARYGGVNFGKREKASLTIEEMYRNSRSNAFGPEVKRRILLGTHALSGGYYDRYYYRALQVRKVIAQEFATAFESVDILLCPTSPTVAFPLGQRTDDPLAMYLSDLYTLPVNLARACAISVPCGFANGLPVGLQCIAMPMCEERLFQFARVAQATQTVGNK